jgi:ribonuclease-3
LALAMAHRSWCAETAGETSNERLEFLGDAVLGLVVTDHLFLTYPDLPEGELAKVRASVVNSEALAEVAAELSLGDALLLGKGEDSSGGREKPSILADAMEAVIGAVYLDGGWEPAAELVMGLLGDRIEEAAAGPGGQDYKTRLQELAARKFEQLPRYEVTDEGPDHAKRFFAIVLLGGVQRGRGEGRSKKQAEQGAAREAWHELSAIVVRRDGVAGAAPDA